MFEKIDGIYPSKIQFNYLYSQNSKNDDFEFKFHIDKKQNIQMETKSEQLYNGWSKIIPNLSIEFFDEIVEMSKRLKCNPDDLTAIMFRESQFNPAANCDDKYYGLIQMTNKSFKNSINFSKQKYGDNSPVKDISFDNYKKLSREKQLKYAEAYIEMLKDKQGLSDKELSGGLMWAMIKSPKLAKDKTDKGEHFREKLQKIINKTKDLAKTDSVPFYLKRY